MKLSPHCSHVNKDGTPCGRKVTDGSQPPVCHIHARRNGGIAVPGPFDPASKLRKIAANDRHPQQLQALKVLLDRETTCPRCAAAVEATTAREQFLARITPEQRDRLRELIAEVNAIKAAAITQPVGLDSVETQETEHAAVLEHQEPPRSATEAPQPSTERAERTELDQRQPVGSQADREKVRLDKSLWPSVGIVEMHGVPTHAQGDEHAEDIITGKIPFAAACAAHEADEGRAKKIAQSVRAGQTSPRRIV
jgi:hypothetical protein